MDELKEAVYQKALQESIEYLSECNDYSPAFKEFGLRWIRLIILTLLFMAPAYTISTEKKHSKPPIN